MRTTAAILGRLHLPIRDAHDLPESPKRFADGGQYRIEIPSCEGARAMEAVLAAAGELGVPIHRVSQGSGVMLQTDDEIGRMVALGREHGVEVCLFVGPRANWDVGVQAASSAGKVLGSSLPQIAAIRRAIDAAIDFYVEAPDDFGGTVRHYEIAELVRITAPIYLEFGLWSAPGIYPSGRHLEPAVLAMSRERVRRAAIGLALLKRYAPAAVPSPLGARVS